MFRYSDSPPRRAINPCSVVAKVRSAGLKESSTSTFSTCGRRPFGYADKSEAVREPDSPKASDGDSAPSPNPAVRPSARRRERVRRRRSDMQCLQGAAGGLSYVVIRAATMPQALSHHKASVRNRQLVAPEQPDKSRPPGRQVEQLGVQPAAHRPRHIGFVVV